MTTAQPADRRRIWALVVICLAAGTLYAWKIGAGEMGNSYYSAAVKSMTHSFTNFLFGSFDPYGFATVDKPPLSLWPQVFSVWIFGYHGWALLLPQVIEGVAAVFLLHRTVRLWAGENVALLAAAILALTPVTVAVNRTNNTDTLLVLLLVAAAYAVTRSIGEPSGRGSTRWLFWCAFFVGCGFLTKMLQAWIIVPALALAYLAGSTAPVKRRIFDLLGATGVLFASSFWWVALHDWWPGGKPYVSGSADGSAWDLVFGYNGFGRVFGQHDGPTGTPGAAMPQVGQLPGGPDSGLNRTFSTGVGNEDSGLTRMFSSGVGGQISWLLPLAVVVLILVAVAGARRIAAKRPGDPAGRGGWFLWGGWLLITALVFSYAQGIWHSYYTTMLAPAVAAVAAAGLARLWRYYRDSETAVWLLLPAAITLTAAWAFVLAARNPDWHGWTRWAVLAVAAAAVGGLVTGKLGRDSLKLPAFVAGLVTLLLTPGVWSAAAAGEGGSGMPVAGPRSNVPQVQELPRGAVIMAAGAGDDSGGLSAEQRGILDYAVKNSEGAEIDLAINGAAAAARYVMNSEAVVIAMGGFMGSDHAPTVDQLQGWVRDGTLKFVLGSSPESAGTSTMASPGGAAQRERQQWIEQNCTVIDPGRYGGSDDKPQVFDTMSGGKTLYQCG